MIESLRVFATSWVAKVLLALLIASFAVFGVQLASTGGYTVAEVGDEEISTLEFRRLFARQMQLVALRRAQAGVREPLTQAQVVQAGVHRQIAQSLIRFSALGQEALSLGVDAPDAAVREGIEADRRFHGAEGFDAEIYRRQLNDDGYRRTEYETEQRRILAVSLMRAPIPLGVTAPKEAGEILWRRENETRKIGYLTLTEAQIAEIKDPGDEALRAFYEAEARLFTKPERRDLDILIISPKEMADADAIPEDRLKRAYEDAGERFNLPERRNLERLDFETQKEARAAARRVRRGASLADIAAEIAAAKTKAAQEKAAGAEVPKIEAEEVSLGYVTQQQLAAFTPDLAKAVFADGAKDVLPPIKVGERWAVVKIAGVRPGRFTPFDEARITLAEELALADARRETPQLANDVEDALAAGASYEEIAKERRGVIRRKVNIDAQGRLADGAAAKGLPTDSRFLEEAFSRAEGEERDLTPAQDGSYWTAVATKIVPAALRPFDEARADVLTAWRAGEKTAALNKRAEEAVKRIDAGEAPKAVAAALGVDYKEAKAVTRVGGGGLPVSAVRAAFSLGAGEAVGRALTARDGESRLVLSTLEVSAPDPGEAGDAVDAKRTEAAAGMANDLLVLFEAAVEAKYDGELYAEALQRAALTPLR